MNEDKATIRARQTWETFTRFTTVGTVAIAVVIAFVVLLAY